MSVNLDWGSLGFGYIKTPYRYVSNFKDGKWDEGGLTAGDKVDLSEGAGGMQCAQTWSEELKA